MSACLPDRAIVRVTGSGARAFLQGLITNDIDKAKPGNAIHVHNRARDTFIEVDGVTQPAPAPRFSRTPAAVKCPPPAASTRDDSALSDWGFAADDISALRNAGVLK